jgi:hypothetical protein
MHAIQFPIAVGVELGLNKQIMLNPVGLERGHDLRFPLSKDRVFDVLSNRCFVLSECGASQQKVRAEHAQCD